jgi:hypothetical protein
MDIGIDVGSTNPKRVKRKECSLIQTKLPCAKSDPKPEEEQINQVEDEIDDTPLYA